MALVCMAHTNRKSSGAVALVETARHTHIARAMARVCMARVIRSLLTLIRSLLTLNRSLLTLKEQWHVYAWHAPIARAVTLECTAGGNRGCFSILHEMARDRRHEPRALPDLLRRPSAHETSCLWSLSSNK
jgi:hypothetical protein